MLKVRVSPAFGGGVMQTVEGVVENDTERRLVAAVFGPGVYHGAYADTPFWEAVRVEDYPSGASHPPLLVSAPPGTLTLSWSVTVAGGRDG